MHRDGILPDSCLVLFCPSPPTSMRMRRPCAGACWSRLCQTKHCRVSQWPSTEIGGLDWLLASLSSRLLLPSTPRDENAKHGPPQVIEGIQGGAAPSIETKQRPAQDPTVHWARDGRDERYVRSRSLNQPLTRALPRFLHATRSSRGYSQELRIDGGRVLRSSLARTTSSKKTFRHANSHLLDALPETLIMQPR